MPEEDMPLIRGPQARQRPEWSGSCDWGRCDEHAVALRWSGLHPDYTDQHDRGDRYLPVCERHTH